MDTNSMHGTTVDSCVLMPGEPTELRHGSEIVFGSTVYRAEERILHYPLAFQLSVDYQPFEKIDSHQEHTVGKQHPLQNLAQPGYGISTADLMVETNSDDDFAVPQKDQNSREMLPPLFHHDSQEHPTAIHSNENEGIVNWSAPNVLGLGQKKHTVGTEVIEIQEDSEPEVLKSRIYIQSAGELSDSVISDSGESFNEDEGQSRSSNPTEYELADESENSDDEIPEEVIMAADLAPDNQRDDFRIHMHTPAFNQIAPLLSSLVDIAAAQPDVEEAVETLKAGSPAVDDFPDSGHLGPTSDFVDDLQSLSHTSSLEISSNLPAAPEHELPDSQLDGDSSSGIDDEAASLHYEYEDEKTLTTNTTTEHTEPSSMSSSSAFGSIAINEIVNSSDFHPLTSSATVSKPEGRLSIASLLGVDDNINMSGHVSISRDSTTHIEQKSGDEELAHSTFTKNVFSIDSLISPSTPESLSDTMQPSKKRSHDAYHADSE